MGRHKRREHSRLAGRGKQSGISKDGSYVSSSIATHVEQFPVREIPAAPLRCVTRCLAQPLQRSTMELIPDTRVQYLRNDDVRDDGECCDDTAQGIVGLRPRRCKTISKYVDIDDSDIDNKDRVNEESDEDSSNGAEYNDTTQGIGGLRPRRRCKNISKYVEMDDGDIDNSSCGDEDSINDKSDEESSKWQCM